MYKFCLRAVIHNSNLIVWDLLACEDILFVLLCVQSSLIKDYLKNKDVDKAVDGIKDQLSSMSKDNLCTLCITKTLGKSGKGFILKVSVLCCLL